MCLFSLILDSRSNTLTFIFFYNIRNTNFCIWIVNIITTTTTFTRFNTKWKKHRLTSININNLWSCFTLLLLIEIQLNGIAFNEFAFVKLDKIVNPMKNTFFLTNLNIFVYTGIFFIKYLWMSTILLTSVAS